MCLSNARRGHITYLWNLAEEPMFSWEHLSRSFFTFLTANKTNDNCTEFWYSLRCLLFSYKISIHDFLRVPVFFGVFFPRWAVSTTFFSIFLITTRDRCGIFDWIRPDREVKLCCVAVSANVSASPLLWRQSWDLLERKWFFFSCVLPWQKVRQQTPQSSCQLPQSAHVTVLGDKWLLIIVWWWHAELGRRFHVRWTVVTFVATHLSPSANTSELKHCNLPRSRDEGPLDLPYPAPATPPCPLTLYPSQAHTLREWEALQLTTSNSTYSATPVQKKPLQCLPSHLELLELLLAIHVAKKIYTRINWVCKLGYSQYQVRVLSTSNGTFSGRNKYASTQQLRESNTSIIIFNSTLTFEVSLSVYATCQFGFAQKGTNFYEYVLCLQV